MIKLVQTTEDMPKAITGSTVYISGPITGVEKYREIFCEAERYLMSGGMIAINPAYMPEGLRYDDYFPTCYAQINVSNALCFLGGYAKSTGAAREARHAQNSKKEYRAFTMEQYRCFRMMGELHILEKVLPDKDRELRERVRGHMKSLETDFKRERDELCVWMEGI